MKLDRRLRVGLGVLGGGLVVMTVALAWLKPDGVTVVGFLSAGVLLLLLAALPRVPTKIGIGGGSLEYTVEGLIEHEYVTTFEQEMLKFIGDEWRIRAQNLPEGTGSPGPVTLDVAREMAREATTPWLLMNAIETARSAAREQTDIVFRLLRTSDPPQE